jgi:general secretion pathway protein E
LFAIDEDSRRLIHDGVGEYKLREHALAQGMLPMRMDALRWLLAGETSIDEVLRATREGT